LKYSHLFLFLFYFLKFTFYSERWQKIALLFFRALALASGKNKCAICAAGGLSALGTTCLYYDLCDVKIGDFSAVAILLLNVCRFVLNPI